MISITRVIQYIHKYKKQADSVVSGTNSLLISWLLGSWRHEERDTILTMLTPTPTRGVVFKISVHLHRSGPEKLNHRRNGRKLNCLPPWSNLNWRFFNILKISGRHPHSSPISGRGFIMTMVIVICFAHERKTAPNDYAPGLTRIFESLAKLNAKIWLTKNDWYKKNNSLII